MQGPGLSLLYIWSGHTLPHPRALHLGRPDELVNSAVVYTTIVVLVDTRTERKRRGMSADTDTKLSDQAPL